MLLAFVLDFYELEPEFDPELVEFDPELVEFDPELVLGFDEDLDDLELQVFSF